MVDKVKVAFVGHSYHSKTKSADFFLAYLNELGYDVQLFLDASWAGGASVAVDDICGGNYDKVIVWQVETVVRSLAERAPRSDLIFVPMYDGCKDLPDEFWLSIASNTRVIAFSRTLHEKMQRLGLSSIYVQFFPSLRPRSFRFSRQDGSIFFLATAQRLWVAGAETTDRKQPNLTGSHTLWTRPDLR